MTAIQLNELDQYTILKMYQQAAFNLTETTVVEDQEYYVKSTIEVHDKEFTELTNGTQLCYKYVYYQPEPGFASDRMLRVLCIRHKDGTEIAEPEMISYLRYFDFQKQPKTIVSKIENYGRLCRQDLVGEPLEIMLAHYHETKANQKQKP